MAICQIGVNVVMVICTDTRMEWNNTHRLAVDNAWNLDGELTLEFAEGLYQRFPLGRARSVCSLAHLDQSPTISLDANQSTHTIGSLEISGTLNDASWGLAIVVVCHRRACAGTLERVVMYDRCRPHPIEGSLYTALST